MHVQPGTGDRSSVPPDLTGRRALVTGGASDIGRSVCRALGDRGAQVLATDIDAAGLEALRAERPEIETAVADLTDEQALQGLALERVEVFAAVAGLPVVEPFAESDPAGWDRLWAINLRAPMRLTQRILPGMRDRGWGRLVYVSSDSARAGAGGEAVYAATKAGLLGFAKSVAREGARAGVTANVVCPGPIDTARSREILDERPRLRESLVRAIPAGRLGHPDEVAAAVAFLSAADAGYITGQVLSVNGGITMA